MSDVNNIIEIYNSYLQTFNKERGEDEYHKDSRWFNISGAGMCLLKHWYKQEGVETEPMSDDSARLLRLGTLVHEDIQKALEWWENQQPYGLDLSKVGKPIFLLEQRVELPEYNCRGALDVFAIEDGILTDLKTTAAYKWKMMFGRNPDPSPSVNYQLQVGTYGMWLHQNSYNLQGLELLYYNKDNSSMRAVPVAMEYLDEAAAYWEMVKEMLADGKPPVSLGSAPVMKWECNEDSKRPGFGKYCPYFNVCGGGLKV